MEIVGTYNWLLVVISVIAATGASFVALSTVPRIFSSASGTHSLAWVAAFGLSLGAGIWTMHFIAILALQMPIPVKFDITLTMISLLLAVVASAIAIAPLRAGGGLKAFAPRTLFFGSMMGFGVAGMHYTGMAAMRLNATMYHDMFIVALAIAIAIIASTAALLIANRLRNSRIFSQLITKSVSAIIMGMAVSAMHYTAMAGTSFHEAAAVHDFGEVIDPLILAVFILIVAFLIQGGIIVTALFGEAYTVSEEVAAAMKRRADINKALSEILALALENHSLAEILKRVLDVILSIEWLPLQGKGSVFLADDKKRELKMVARRGLGEELQVRCSSVAYGHCLCGMAAERGEMIFKSCVDSDHVTRPDGMMDHGHFCIPVLAHGALLGLMNLYLPHGHQPGKDELSFLESVAGAVANIIQNKQMEAKADKIFKAINQAGEAVLITDSNGVIEYVNQAYCTTTGYSEAEAIGQNPSMLNSGKQNRAFYDQIWGTITSGQVWQGEITEKRKDGSTYPAMLTISPIRDSEGEGEGEITHFVGIHEDLSEHKALEAQFRQAQKMEALGTLVGGIAHDFNNMLAGMIGNLFLIKKKMEGMPELQERVEQVETVGFQAADIIKQMMVFARSEQVEMGLVSFTALIKELFRLHQIVISEHIRLEKTIIGQKLDIKGDATQLQQLLLNLFGNAVDAVRERESPVITLLLEPFYADQAFCSKYKDAEIRDYAHLMVRDNGYGIEQKNLENIFDPFFTTKEVGRGTGLGLSMSSTIVKSHGGFIRVESESGVGTEFHVYIPLVEGIAGTRDSGKIEDTVTGRGELVLIADDNSALRHSTAEALESLGYRTVLAENGRQAVDIYRSNAVSVILFDVVMPEMGGPEAAREILAFDPAANIIFATGYDKSASLPELKGIESIPLLSKPFQIQELSRIIRLLLD